MVRTQDVRGGVFKMDQAAHVSEETYRERTSRVEPRFGDLLYSREGTYFGDAAEVPPGVRVCLGQRMVLLRPDPAQVSTRLLRYWLNSPILKGHIQGQRDGTVAERLNLPTIRALPVLLPPLPAQGAIADVLGALDDKIDLNLRTNETLEAMARTLFKSWFVDFDPVRAKAEGRVPAGMDAATAALFPDGFEESVLGEIPRGWRALPLGDAFRLTMGQSPPGSSYNEAGDGLPFYQGTRDFGFRYPIPRVYCTAPTRFAEPEDTLVSVRAPVGTLNLSAERCCIGRGVAAVRHKSGSSPFTYRTMQTLEPAFLRFEGEGTVFGSINKDQFEKLVVLEPTPGVLEDFTKIAGNLDMMVAMNTKESASLAALRDALLPKLLSGELRVRDADRIVERAV